MRYGSIPAIAQKDFADPPQAHMSITALPTVQQLTEDSKSEALEFLAARPPHTVIIDGLLRQNGLDSGLNRGTFYVCRDRHKAILGIALIGHHVLFETSDDHAIREFAKLARETSAIRFIMGETDKITRFWIHYAGKRQIEFSVERELLLEQRWPVEALQDVPGLRLATAEDLELVAEAHAAVAVEEQGIDVLGVDPVGFTARCARRIEQGRVWVWIENGRLIFKVDIVSETPYVTYLEGAFVAPPDRSRGYGLRCFSLLSRQILQRTASICLLVNERNQAARSFYQSADFKLLSRYVTIFLH
jgi:ribosomal protein S18 acetylase RimI-like enzyme